MVSLDHILPMMTKITDPDWGPNPDYESGLLIRNPVPVCIAGVYILHTQNYGLLVGWGKNMMIY